MGILSPAEDMIQITPKLIIKKPHKPARETAGVQAGQGEMQGEMNEVVSLVAPSSARRKTRWSRISGPPASYSAVCTTALVSSTATASPVYNTLLHGPDDDSLAAIPETPNKVQTATDILDAGCLHLSRTHLDALTSTHSPRRTPPPLPPRRASETTSTSATARRHTGEPNADGDGQTTLLAGAWSAALCASCGSAGPRPPAARLQIVFVNADDDPNLWWAVRGADAAFGIATGYKADVLPVPEVFAGNLIYATAAPLNNHCRDCIEDAPFEHDANVLLSNGPANKHWLVTLIAPDCGCHLRGPPTTMTTT
ncbi:hypothetical protein L226DRAFT_575638 [Lentinus tigrinus ALCF2SS1-7]|uniref:Uncharacterized protein n=1 Tax=Lentinus tigrinus ALCF2SS1-6 TaxID=1328759 RepID=A0A5C2SCQ2_9APHY|nr:hypothetical protein L227DRAFT_610528 [Lentinus tigrinus ALCF2SS1-6]RPD69489.1 hypothetical protein L226DRAFT_575638 [Lentinus tigrinus ALCF2SS1-7]